MSMYIIERSIIFDPDAPSLAVMESTKEPTAISAAAARCLLVLIDTGGEPVEREQLMHAGWGTVGQVVSENSLNQAITQLRKLFKEFDLQGDVIKTVPRVGYKISRSLCIELRAMPIENSPDAAPTNEFPAPAFAEPNLTVLESHRQVNPLKTRLYIYWLTGTFRPLMLLFVLVIASYVLFYSTNQQAIEQMSTKIHRVNYLPIATDFSQLNVFFNQDIEQQSEYLKNAIKQFERDNWFHHYLGGDARYIYINGSYNRDVFSYFLCRNEIQKHPEGCRAYTSIQEGI